MYDYKAEMEAVNIFVDTVYAIRDGIFRDFLDHINCIDKNGNLIEEKIDINRFRRRIEGSGVERSEALLFLQDGTWYEVLKIVDLPTFDENGTMHIRYHDNWKNMDLEFRM